MIERLKRVYRKIRSLWRNDNFYVPLCHRPIVYPPGETEESVFNYLASWRLDEEGTEEEMTNYLRHDFKRFLITLNLLPPGNGRLLEIGANPYFTSMLIRKFTSFELFMTNWFGDGLAEKITQYKVDGGGGRIAFESCHHNVEAAPLPFDDGFFDVICFCEVIEHLTHDPLKALTHLKEKLKPGGHLVLSTPNVARLENIARLLAGANLYDPYSGYGPYGRHNREYNRHELALLLDHLGFELEEMFTADVHGNASAQFFDLSKIKNLVMFRKGALGQYVFLRARNSRAANPKKPSWLYRSYPSGELD